MARKLSSGVTGRPILGSLAISGAGTITSRETNTSIDLVPDGTGDVSIASDAIIKNANGLVFNNTNNTNTIKLAVNGGFSADLTYTLPSTLTADYFLKTDGNGNLSWAEAAVAVSNQTADSNTYYPVITTTTSGTLTTVNTSNTKLTFVPNTGALGATSFNGTNSTLTGTLQAATITETSSIALKENVTPIENALDKIQKLVGVVYDRRDGSTKNEAGLIAEEVAKVLPNIVNKDDEGNPHSIQYTKLTAYLIEAVKNLAKEVEELKR